MTQTYDYQIPRRRIVSEQDLALFQSSSTYAELLGFVDNLNGAVCGCANDAPRRVSPAITAVLGVLSGIEALIERHPPVDNAKSRFGNPAFRDFYDDVQASLHALHGPLEPALPKAAVDEVGAYLAESFGNRTRIDYGSGHELNFLCYLLCLAKLGIFVVSDRPTHERLPKVTPARPGAAQRGASGRGRGRGASALLDRLKASAVGEAAPPASTTADAPPAAVTAASTPSLDATTHTAGTTGAALFADDPDAVSISALEAISSTDDARSIVLDVFRAYLSLMRRVQAAYWLEPAGSHGVWGLDDYHFLPFLLGASQLRTHAHLRPASIRDRDSLRHYQHDYLYLACVAHLEATKSDALDTAPSVAASTAHDDGGSGSGSSNGATGGGRSLGLRWHSPMLDDISSAKSWAKVNDGLLKMYTVEVLGKVPVVQHFLFGSILPAAEGMSPPPARDEDGNEHIHNTWADCCGIKVPSAMAAAAAASSSAAGAGGGEQRIRRLDWG